MGIEVILLLVPPLILIGASILVVKARPWLRVVVLIAVAAGAAYLAFGLATGITRARFMSSHIHWFRDYSAYLNRLAEQNDTKGLKETVILFNHRFQQDPSSPTNIEDIMYQIFGMGPYREAEATGAPNEASQAIGAPQPERRCWPDGQRTIKRVD